MPKLIHMYTYVWRATPEWGSPAYAAHYKVARSSISDHGRTMDLTRMIVFDRSFADPNTRMPAILTKSAKTQGR